MLGITDEQVEPPIFAIICQRLVSSVDDGSIELHPLINIVYDMIGPLADLKRNMPWRSGTSKSNASGLACPTLPAPEKICRVGQEREQGG